MPMLKASMGIFSHVLLLAGVSVSLDLFVLRAAFPFIGLGVTAITSAISFAGYFRKWSAFPIAWRVWQWEALYDGPIRAYWLVQALVFAAVFVTLLAAAFIHPLH